MAGLIEHQALAPVPNMAIPPAKRRFWSSAMGPRRAPGRALALHRHAARVAATELFARVEAACLEEPPFVADTLRGLRAHPVIVIGFFANQGGHVRDDMPALVSSRDSNARQQRVKGDASMAVWPRILTVTQIILDQAGRHDPRRRIRCLPMSAATPRPTGTGGATASTSIRSMRSAAAGSTCRTSAGWKTPRCSP